jgi:hypothetical protein
VKRKGKRISSKEEGYKVTGWIFGFIFYEGQVDKIRFYRRTTLLLNYKPS